MKGLVIFVLFIFLNNILVLVLSQSKKQNFMKPIKSECKPSKTFRISQEEYDRLQKLNLDSVKVKKVKPIGKKFLKPKKEKAVRHKHKPNPKPRVNKKKITINDLLLLGKGTEPEDEKENIRRLTRIRRTLEIIRSVHYERHKIYSTSEEIEHAIEEIKYKITKKMNIRPKLKMHLSAVKDFFVYLFKAFKHIEGKTENIIVDGKRMILKEKLDGYFYCKDVFDSISADNIEIMKESIDRIDYKNFKKTMTEFTGDLRNFVNLIGDKCTGLNVMMDLLTRYIHNLKLLRPDYLSIVEMLKNRAYYELDKHSFAEAGYTIGKIYGEAKKLTFYENYL